LPGIHPPLSHVQGQEIVQRQEIAIWSIRSPSKQLACLSMPLGGIGGHDARKVLKHCVYYTTYVQNVVSQLLVGSEWIKECTSLMQYIRT
jgi:hypothetical protein